MRGNGEDDIESTPKDMSLIEYSNLCHNRT